MREKKYSAPRPRDGQLKVQWGSLEGEPAELVYAGGEGTARADRALMHHMLASVNWLGPMNKSGAFDPSILEQLDARGYDITTLKISIEKKS